MRRLFSSSDDRDKLPEVESEDSVFQVFERVTKKSPTFSETFARQIEIDRKRVELKEIRKRYRSIAEAEADAATASLDRDS